MQNPRYTREGEPHLMESRPFARDTQVSDPGDLEEGLAFREPMTGQRYNPQEPYGRFGAAPQRGSTVRSGYLGEGGGMADTEPSDSEPE